MRINNQLHEICIDMWDEVRMALWKSRMMRISIEFNLI